MSKQHIAWMLKKTQRPIIYILLITFCISSYANANEQAKFKRWTKDFKKTLYHKHSISKKTISKIFKDTKLLEKVLHKDKNQLHTKISFSKYMKLIVSKTRIKRGRQKFRQNKTLLKKIENKYGVDASVITALWGVESFYGKIQGKYTIIDSLLSLIHDGRRAKFFTKELLHTIKILEENGLSKNDIKGSWAGAMGACQFMPSTYTHYAVDWDGDGVRDIWDNKKDIFASIANLISKSGFRANEPIAVEIYPKKSLLKYKKISIRALERLGMKYKNRASMRNINKNIKVKIAKYDKRYFVIFKNFSVIKRWNNSDFFAISVALLSDKIKSK